MRLFYKGYIGTASYSQDDGCYVGHIVNTRDIVSYEGDNMKELKEDFINAIKDMEEQDK